MLAGYLAASSCLIVSDLSWQHFCAVLAACLEFLSRLQVNLQPSLRTPDQDVVK